MLSIIAIAVLFFYAILGFKKPAIALITMPIACCLLVYAAILQDTPEVILSVPVIFLLTLITIASTKPEPDSKQWSKTAAKWILKIIAFLLLAGVVFVVIHYWGLLFYILFAALLINYDLTSRHAIAAYVISTIGSSMRQNLPLPMALETAASGRADKCSTILRRINKWLVQGFTLSESIKRGYPKCPGYVVAMIAAAEKINQLPLAIKCIEADMVAKADEKRRIRPVHPFYPVLLIVFVFLLVLAFTILIIPKIKGVLTGVLEGAQLPLATQFLVNITDYVARPIGPVFLGMPVFWIISFAFIVFIIVPLSIRLKFRPRRPDKPFLISRIGDFIKWHLPILHWFEKNYSMTQTIELLRLSLNAGCTVNDAIANTLNLDVNNCFKKRLRKWLRKVEAGENIASAAKDSKLGDTLAWAFDDTVNPGNTLTILEMLESFYRANYSYRVNLARFILAPCVVITVAVIVGFIIYAIFAPMILIISKLADAAIP